MGVLVDEVEMRKLRVSVCGVVFPCLLKLIDLSD